MQLVDRFTSRTYTEGSRPVQLDTLREWVASIGASTCCGPGAWSSQSAEIRLRHTRTCVGDEIFYVQYNLKLRLAQAVTAAQ